MNDRARKIGDGAVEARTGKVWAEWFTALDADGAADMKHAGIARLLAERHGLPGWWAQMVTVEYERERGMRAVHQTPRGFAVSVSKTVGVSIGRAYSAWADEDVRGRWLTEPVKIRKANANKSMRIETGNAGSDLAVHFYARGENRCQVTVQQMKLADRAQVEDRRAFWKETLSRLAQAAASA